MSNLLKLRDSVTTEDLPDFDQPSPHDHGGEAELTVRGWSKSDTSMDMESDDPAKLCSLSQCAGPGPFISLLKHHRMCVLVASIGGDMLGDKEAA